MRLNPNEYIHAMGLFYGKGDDETSLLILVMVNASKAHVGYEHHSYIFNRSSSYILSFAIMIDENPLRLNTASVCSAFHILCALHTPHINFPTYIPVSKYR